MEEAILNFKTQLTYEPEIKNAEKLKATNKFIVCGMGGSALPANFWRAANPKFDLLVHRDYGLPRVPEYFLKESLLIFCSYSGETEETISAFQAARQQNLALAVITGGGQLWRLAEAAGVPRIQLPTAANLQPRLALGYFLRSLGRMFGATETLAELAVLATSLPLPWLKSTAQDLSLKLKGTMPLLYTSTPFYPLAYAWKINLNETTKIPAFANVLPEANHNEIAGAGLARASSLPAFRQSLSALFLTEATWSERLRARLSATIALYERQGIKTEVCELPGPGVWASLINGFLLSAWTSVFLARLYQIDPETNPTIENFKRELTEAGTTLAN